MSTTERQLRKQICLAGRELRLRGLNVGAEGNISCRLDSSRILITPAGKDKAGLTPDEIVAISFAGRCDNQAQQPSSEWRLHAAAYAAGSELGAAVHLHSPYATAFAVAERPLPLGRFTETAALLGEAPLVPYAAPSSQELADSVAAQLNQAHTFLLARHGAVCFAADLKQALDRAIALEHCAQVLWLAESLRDGSKRS